MELEWATLWKGLFWPLIRLTFFISVGLFIGNLIESLRWTRHVAKLADPLARQARLRDVSGASFTMAFFSGVSANTMLAEAYEKNELSRRELVLSNLFNSLPTYFLHLPTIFFIAAPFIGGAAAVYVGLTALSALLRTAFIVLVGRLTLPPPPEGCLPCVLENQKLNTRFRDALKNTWKRFKKRLPKIIYFTVPIFTLFFFLRQGGIMAWLQQSMADNLTMLSWLPPEAMSIIGFHMAAEFTAGLAAAGALIQDNAMTTVQVVLALMAGNILSSPMRAVRHQFPYYAGIFKPRTAIVLIIYNQTLRAASLILVGLIYYLFT